MHQLFCGLFVKGMCCHACIFLTFELIMQVLLQVLRVMSCLAQSSWRQGLRHRFLPKNSHGNSAYKHIHTPGLRLAAPVSTTGSLQLQVHVDAHACQVIASGIYQLTIHYFVAAEWFIGIATTRIKAKATCPTCHGRDCVVFKRAV